MAELGAHWITPRMATYGIGIFGLRRKGRACAPLSDTGVRSVPMETGFWRVSLVAVDSGAIFLYVW